MRTNLSDGGYLDTSWIQSSSGGQSYITGLRYNAAGQEIARTDPITSATADYQVVALDNGGFVIGTNYGVRYGYDLALYVFDASTRMSYVSSDPSGTVASPTSWQIMAGDGGFASSWLNTGGRTGAYSYDGGYAIYNNAGQMLASESLTGPPTITLAGEGDYRFDWYDGRNSHSLLVDSEAPRDYPSPTAPGGLQLIDDEGPVTGFVSPGEVTDDRAPGFRVAVTEEGWVAVSLDATRGAPNRFVQVTVEDVARGYKDLPNPDVWPNDTYNYNGPIGVAARFLSADGIPGASATFVFEFDTYPRNAPAITRVSDDAGAQQGDVGAGGSTDDTTPTFQISLVGTYAGAGDSVQLYNGETRLASTVVTAAAQQQGFINVTPTLANGPYNVTAFILTEAGNPSPASSSFAFTLQSGGGAATLNLTGTVSAAEGQAGPTPFTFTVNRSGDLTGASEASYFVWHESTATADFAGNTSGRVIFAAGESSKPVVVYVAGETTVEPDEAFHVQLYGANGAAIGANDANGVIVNDDGSAPPPPPASNFQFSTTSVTRAEGNAGTTAFDYVITRTGDVQYGASVFVSVAGSGIYPADGSDTRLITDEVVSFAAGETSKTYRVVVNGDTTAEADERFTLTLAPTPHSWNTAGPDRQAQGTILNDDAAPSEEGRVISSPGPGSTLQGGPGNDTLVASQGPDVLTGGGGGDAFVYAKLPWNAGHATDFTLGADRLDLSGIFQASGYTGSDPVADGRMRFDSDGAGATKIYFDPDAPNSGEWPFLITTLDDVSPNGLTWTQLSGGGSQPPPPPTGEGNELTWRQQADTLTGGSGNDTLNASQGPDQLTGGGGADQFAWANLPWNAGHVTDFTPGSDKLDLRALFQASGYAGSDPIGDGRLEFRPNGQGDTQVYFDRDTPSGGDWPFLITTLDKVQPAQMGAGDWLFK